MRRGLNKNKIKKKLNEGTWYFVSELQYACICSTFCLQWELLQQCTKAQLLPRTLLIQDLKYHSWSYSRISYVGRMKLFIRDFSQAAQNYNPYSAIDTSHSLSVKCREEQLLQWSVLKDLTKGPLLKSGWHGQGPLAWYKLCFLYPLCFPGWNSRN